MRPGSEKTWPMALSRSPGSTMGEEKQQLVGRRGQGGETQVPVGGLFLKDGVKPPEVSWLESRETSLQDRLEASRC